MSNQIGEEYTGVVTGITNFGIFIQLERYLIEGLIRYESLMDDWWDVDARNGFVRGQRTGTRINIGDVCKIYIVRVDTARRELDLAISELVGRGKRSATTTELGSPKPKKPTKRNKQDHQRRPPQQHRGHSKPKGRGKRGRR